MSDKLDELNKNNIIEINKRSNDNQCCVEEVGDMVQKLVRVFQLFERDQIKVNGFTTTQCYTLLELKKNHSLSMNDLSEKMNLNSSTMTRILDNLVRDKYVTREKHEEDRRIVMVSLTEEGIKVSEKLNEVLIEYYRKIIDNIPEGQVEEILNSIEILLKAFNKANPNCC
jgi:MarR family transcriptional regulator, organic hydroperoxide resistance regulator